MHLENKSVSKKFFWTLWIMYAVVYMTKSCYSAAMASIVHEGVLTKSQTGFITAAFYFVYVPLQILGGILFHLIFLYLWTGACVRCSGDCYEMAT